MRVNKKTKKALSILMCFCMLISYVPVSALAEETDNLCDHHTAHTADCGYAATGEGNECHYECTECAVALTSEGDTDPTTEPADEPTTEPTTEPATESAAEPAPVCICGTDDDTVHATSCPLYVAPENPVCTCAEKCVEANVWCDVCGVQGVDACEGENTATGYDLGTQEINGVTYYEIGTADELYAFAELVNSGETSANGILTEDIYFNYGVDNFTESAREWNPIGTYSNPYKGIFEGDDRSIIGLYVDNSDADYVGLFGCVSGGTVRNVTVQLSYLCGKDYVGGIVGDNGNGTVVNCATWDSWVIGDIYVGGVVGCNNAFSSVTDCSSSAVTKGVQFVGGIAGANINASSVTGCGHFGSLAPNTTGSLDVNTTEFSFFGGVVGFAMGSPDFFCPITNCYNTSDIDVSDAGGVVAACGFCSVTNCYSIGSAAYGVVKDIIQRSLVTNCYYRTSTYGDDGGAVAKSVEQFNSGEVAYLLNNGVTDGTQVWYQTCGEGYPAFSGKTVYQINICNGSTTYSNTNENKTDHTWEDGKCIICGAVCGEDVEHILTYTDNQGDTHTASCTFCGYTATVSHSFDETTNECACGKLDTYTVSQGHLIKHLDSATVNSGDQDVLEKAIEVINELLKGDSLREEERKSLEDIKTKAEALLDVIDAAASAIETENTEKVEDVTAENVKPEDKETLAAAKADLEKALDEYGANYTEEEKKAIQEEIQRIEDAIEALENVEDVTDAIARLPETVEPDDEEAAQKIMDAKKAYDSLTDHEKSLVKESAKAKLDKLVAALTACVPPATGDDSNIGLWASVMCVSTLCLAVLLLDNKRRRSTK